MRVIVVVIVLAGCFRPGAPADVPCGPGDSCPANQSCVDGVCRAPGFEASDDAPPVDTGNSACAGGDDVCLVECVDVDPDCITTCGDGRCVGNAGEMCGICASDCNVASACGNGDCEPGESPDCYADCGPDPWLWDAMEDELFTRVNAARTGGTMCPGATMATTAPALIRHAPFDPQIREWVWEIAHQTVFISGGTSCNGRTLTQRAMPEDFDSSIQSRNHDSVEATVTSWLTSDTICPVVMSTVRTKAGVAVAVDVTEGYIMVME